MIAAMGALADLACGLQGLANLDRDVPAR